MYAVMCRSIIINITQITTTGDSADFNHTGPAISTNSDLHDLKIVRDGYYLSDAIAIKYVAFFSYLAFRTETFIQFGKIVTPFPRLQTESDATRMIRYWFSEKWTLKST